MTGVLELARGLRVDWQGGWTRSGPSRFLDEAGRSLVEFTAGSIVNRVNT
jgi:hypothetical protein